jgi:hypothetical protein
VFTGLHLVEVCQGLGLSAAFLLDFDADRPRTPALVRRRVRARLAEPPASAA